MAEKSRKAVDISVIIPIYNEEQTIPELYGRLRKAVMSVSEAYDFIFVNDGSKDNSLAELMKIAAVDERVYFINFSRNFGHQIAVTAGIDFCHGKAVVIIDGDLQDPPELIPELYDKYKEGYEVVYARRRQRKGETGFKKYTAKVFYRLMKSITSIDIPVDTGDFRLMDHKVVHYLRRMPEQNKFIRGQVAWIGFKQTGVLFDRDERKHGTTDYPLSKMLRFAMDGITSFSDTPLKLVTRLGFLFSFSSFIIILYAFYSYFILERTISGWTSLIISTMFIGGVQLISLGIIGEYIRRMNKNILNRPLYIIKNTNLESETQEK